MAKQKAPTKKELVLANNNELIPFGDTPDYLKSEGQSGLEGLSKDDFRVPRIKLLQALNPEVRTFQNEAIPGEFWHTGVNKSLGSEFIFIAITGGKRVVLWDPNGGKQGGDILAFSRDASTWTNGANKKFKVKLKGDIEVEWNTNKNVSASRLTNWGSSNPDKYNSSPAATVVYEYLCYLPDHPELSPCVMGLFKTAVPNAKSFNTSLLMLRKPTASVAVRCFADEKSEDGNTWFVPQFKLAGYVTKDLFEVAKKLGEQYADYQAEHDKEDFAKAEGVDDNSY